MTPIFFNTHPTFFVVMNNEIFQAKAIDFKVRFQISGDSYSRRISTIKLDVAEVGELEINCGRNYFTVAKNDCGIESDRHSNKIKKFSFYLTIEDAKAEINPFAVVTRDSNTCYWECSVKNDILYAQTSLSRIKEIFEQEKFARYISFDHYHFGSYVWNGIKAEWKPWEIIFNLGTNRIGVYQDFASFTPCDERFFANQADCEQANSVKVHMFA